MHTLAATFFAAAASYRTAVDLIDEDEPVEGAAASAAIAAGIAEHAAVRAVAAAAIVTAEDAAAAASVLAHLLDAEVWPDEARALARSLAAAVDQLSAGW